MSRLVRSVMTAAALSALSALPSPVSLAAQTTDEAAVEGVVRALFDHMRAGDTDAMAALMHPDVRLITTGVRDGVPMARVVPISAWLDGVAAATEVLDERLYELEVQVADNLAYVWTEYSLFVGGHFSHCGVDLFDLVRTADGWRIIQVADTRRQEGCRTS